MAYFQNLFTADFQGNLVIGDRQHSPTFKCRGNSGRGDALVITWKDLPSYNLSINDGSSISRANLNLWFAIDAGTFKNWSKLTVNITQNCNLDGSGNPTLPAVSTAAVTAAEIVTSLNADATFSGKFTASLASTPFASGNPRIQIRQNMPVERCKFYIENGAAEDALSFNARAGIDQLPNYFARHTIVNRWSYTDGNNMLVQLAPSGSNVDATLINAAVDNNGKSLGYDATVTLKDWELLRGRAGYFMFTKNTLDSNTPPRITATLQYAAGAKVGDFAKKITYSYTSTNTTPDQITEYPYVLTSGDLLTPTGTGQ